VLLVSINVIAELLANTTFAFSSEIALILSVKTSSSPNCLLISKTLSA
jgi:hypothetical protein